MTDYHPIPCSHYDHYEIAILHAQVLRVTWRDAQGIVHVETLRPRDLQTKAGEEYLLAETLVGQTLTLRLDKILRAEPVDSA
ncbi:MAG: Rho-binding antiterminator [Gammaproteobacteria bacterium]